MVARPGTESLQRRLEEEQEQHADLLQADLADGHRRLGYKILTGYVWSYLHCPHVKLVAKTDDNVILDLDGRAVRQWDSSQEHEASEERQDSHDGQLEHLQAPAGPRLSPGLLQRLPVCDFAPGLVN